MGFQRVDLTYLTHILTPKYTHTHTKQRKKQEQEQHPKAVTFLHGLLLLDLNGSSDSRDSRCQGTSGVTTATRSTAHGPALGRPRRRRETAVVLLIGSV